MEPQQAICQRNFWDTRARRKILWKDKKNRGLGQQNSTILLCIGPIILRTYFYENKMVAPSSRFTTTQNGPGWRVFFLTSIVFLLEFDFYCLLVQNSVQEVIGVTPPTILFYLIKATFLYSTKLQNRLLPEDPFVWEVRLIE